MSHPLHDRLRRLHNQARRLTILHACGRFFQIGVAAFVAIGLADYWIRSDDASLRFLASAALLCALVWSYLRYLRPALAARLSDLQLASRIEARHPQLKGLVANTISFLGSSDEDPLAGSHQMRRAVVAETMGEIEHLDLGDCLDGSAARRAFLTGLAGLTAVGILLFAAPPATYAAARLLTPWRHQPWPRRNALDMVDPPNRLARGADLEVEIIDRHGKMPDVVTLEILREDGQTHERSAVFVGGRMLARVNNVAKSFQYRAVGGDDDTMPWRELEVVTPPQLLDIRITVTPPAYSGWPEEKFTGDLRGLAGSSVAIQGLIDLPLKSAAILFQPEDAKDSDPLSTPLSVTENAFQTGEEPFELTVSGQLWIDYVDERGVRSGQPSKWNVLVIDDNPPIAAFTTSEANRYATPESTVPLLATLEDDLALAKAELVYKRSEEDEEREVRVPLWEGPDAAPKQASTQQQADRRELKRPWSLAEITDLKPGASLEFHIVAHDYKGQTGSTAVQQLSIVSQAELEDRLARDQGYILERIGEALRSQREARKQITALEIQWQETESFSKADGDQLQSAELNQRQVTRLLAGPKEGALALLDKLSENIANNQLNNPELQRRVAQLRSGVEQATAKLPDVQRRLLGGLRDVRPKLADAKDDARVPASQQTADQLSGASQLQADVIRELEQLLGDMAQWENYRRFAREVGRLQREQADLERRTDQMRLKTLSRDWEQLTPDQRAQLRRLAEEQVGLAQQLDKLQSRMGRASEQLENENPLAADTLSESATTAQRLAISGRMRDIARRLRSNQVGQAKQQQGQVKDDLAELLNILANRREDELDRKLRKLDKLENELAGLEAKERELADELSNLSQDNEADARRLERLAREQEELANEAEEAARRLERLEAENSSDAAANAANAMRASSESGRQSQARQAAEQAKSALEQLQNARKKLQQQIQQTQQDLFFERLARLEQNIRGLAQRQTSVGGTITELLIATETSPLSRQQNATMANLADNQGDLSEEASELASQVTQAKVFHLALEAAAREMSRTATYLRDTKLAEADKASTNALIRLRQLVDALQPPPPSEEPNAQPNQGGQPQQQNQNPNADAINQLAQLKLLKALQQEILQRTEELENLGSTQELTDEQAREYDDLAGEQGRLADILDDLIRSAEEAAAQQEPPSPSEDPEREAGDGLDQLLLDELLNDNPPR